MPTFTSERLARLRSLMKEQDIHVYLVPSEDAHQSEYIADCDKRRHWISGFTGSAGFAIVTLTEAALFTDGRYFLQASQELDENWSLMKQGLPQVPTWQEYLVKNVSAGSRIGLDPTLINAVDAHQLTSQLEPMGSRLIPISQNLIDLAWGKDRPESPKDKVFVQPIEYTGKKRKSQEMPNIVTLMKLGKSVQEKLKELRQHIQKRDAYGTVVSALDEIAWLFNLRGSDIECNPVFFSYAVVNVSEAMLYVDLDKVTEEVKSHLDQASITVKPYTQFFDDLKTLQFEGKKLLVNNKTSLAVEVAVGESNVLEERSFITDAKAIKTKEELEGMRACHLRDGAALVQYLAWLEQKLLAGEKLSEVDGADRLEQFRAAQEHYVGLSFATISSTGPNGAIIHYKPEKETCKIIDPAHIYLCDSGGQYRDGTTDVTRTFHFGTPSAYEKRCFTRVLQGHIAIDQVVFPKGTTGYLLDPFARQPLWQDGLNFLHGTGHGVGSFLNVHEGPHGIGIRVSYNDTPLAAGMTVTNEPGYYEDGKFGIRIENVILVKDVETPNNFGGRGYLGFEHVTIAPMGRNLIDVELLSPSERQWVNDYHQECLTKLGPLVAHNAVATAWLKKETSPI
ncbi:peptidase M24, structural domain-containing protein [Gilbertella persicaria]|uniref:peptidase M24, structural domain-containing protein n=1 Tax=Gilbertella persicaria TaxID=101096 RepID=UPI002220D17F|nr:peptidase M24, structural domain-containing protein [Gilbertella persicaria]KAI8094982.1 peptidase M24, structural domain-containing protein [Gilbertella persicaria]